MEDAMERESWALLAKAGNGKVDSREESAFRLGWKSALAHAKDASLVARLTEENKRLRDVLEKMIAEDNGGKLSWQEIAREALEGE